MRDGRVTIKLLLLMTLVVALGLAFFSWQPSTPVFPVADNGSPTIAIFHHSGGRFVNRDLGLLDEDVNEPVLQFALWRDGTVVWRESKEQIHSKLLTTKIDPTEIDDLFQKLSRARLLDPNMQRQHFGPDSDYTSIEIATDKGQFVILESWHERFEISPGLVCTDRGVKKLEPNEARQKVIADCPKTYRMFRENWDILRNHANKLVVNGGVAYNGSVPKSAKDDFWDPSFSTFPSLSVLQSVNLMEPKRFSPCRPFKP